MWVPPRPPALLFSDRAYPGSWPLLGTWVRFGAHLGLSSPLPDSLGPPPAERQSPWPTCILSTQGGGQEQEGTKHLEDQAGNGQRTGVHDCRLVGGLWGPWSLSCRHWRKKAQGSEAMGCCSGQWEQPAWCTRAQSTACPVNQSPWPPGLTLGLEAFDPRGTLPCALYPGLLSFPILSLVPHSLPSCPSEMSRD